jgi:hypothetical protein
MAGENENVGMEIRLTESQTSSSLSDVSSQSAAQVLDDARNAAKSILGDLLHRNRMRNRNESGQFQAYDDTDDLIRRHQRAAADEAERLSSIDSNKSKEFDDDLARLIRQNRRSAQDEAEKIAAGENSIGAQLSSLFSNAAQGGIGGTIGGLVGSATGSPTVGGLAGAGASALAGAGPAGLAIGAFLSAVTIGTEVLTSLFNRLDALEPEIAQFSGAVASAAAMRGVTEIQTNLDRAERIGPELAALIDARADMAKSLASIETSLLSVIIPQLTEFITNVNTILGPVATVAEVAADIRKKLDMVIDILNASARGPMVGMIMLVGKYILKWFGEKGPDENDLVKQLMGVVDPVNFLLDGPLNNSGRDNQGWPGKPQPRRNVPEIRPPGLGGK